MTRRSSGLPYVALALSALALIVSVLVYSSRRSAGEPGTATAPAAPTTVVLSMVVATFSGQGVFAHRWYPTMMVVREGDAVDLAVANPDEFSHRFEVTGFDMRTKVLNPGESDRLKLTADQVGVFEYHCALPYDSVRKHCTPDHSEMRGYLIVTR